MYYLATRCFQSSFAHLVNALAPGLKLNLLFLGMLAVGHAILPTGWRDTQPALYMLIVGGSAGLAYAAAFLFIPLNALADESLRWRRTLRLAR